MTVKECIWRGSLQILISNLIQHEFKLTLGTIDNIQVDSYSMQIKVLNTGTYIYKDVTKTFQAEFILKVHFPQADITFVSWVLR